MPLCRAVAQCMQGGHKTDVHEYCCAQGCQKPDGFNNADNFAGAMHEGVEWNMYATMEVASSPPVTSCGLTDIAVYVCRCLTPWQGLETRAADQLMQQPYSMTQYGLQVHSPEEVEGEAADMESS